MPCSPRDRHGAGGQVLTSSSHPQPDDAEQLRAAAEHWRRVARDRSAALEAVTRRPVVRAALAIDRRIAPLRSRGAALAGRARASSDRAALALAAGASGGGAAARMAHLTRSLGERSLGERPSATVAVVELVEGRAAAEVARNVDEAIVTAGPSCDVVCLRVAGLEPLAPDWLDRLVAALAGGGGRGVVAVAPTLVHPVRPRREATSHDGSVRAAGLVATRAGEGVVALRAIGAGTEADPVGPVTEVLAATGCLVVDRAAFVAARGWSAIGDVDAALVDLCVRLRAGGGRIEHVPGSVLVDPRPVANRAALVAPFDPAAGPWRDLVEHQAPALWRAAGPRFDGLRFAITTAAPSAKVAERWGDWHLAHGLAAALVRLGHEVRVQTADQADDLASRTCDVHLVARGLRRVRATPGQVQVVWAISHPEAIDDDELEAADLVLAASARLAASLRTRTTTPIDVLLQATDQRRFAPRPKVAAHAHPVVIVAKSRDQLRPMVAEAVAGGLAPAIYGGGWEPFVDPALVVATHVANEDLPVVYSSAGVVLNDHWETMRTAGIVSNRIFDVLACGAPIISDDLPGLDDLLDGTVPTWTTGAELVRLVQADLADPDAARARAERGRALVLGAHTFDHRARELLAALDHHDLRPDLRADLRGPEGPSW